MKIGNAKKVDGLYYFTDNVVLERQVQVVNKSSQIIENEITLWHYRLGHLSFYYLQRLFPYLFKDKSPSLFQREVCEFAKHHKSHFPVKPYKKLIPFVLIHSDVWGPHMLLTFLEQNGLSLLLMIIVVYVGCIY